LQAIDGMNVVVKLDNPAITQEAVVTSSRRSVMRSAKRGKGFSIVDTSLRYLEMLEFIPREPASVSVEEIIEALDRQGFTVEKRTIQRDLHKLAPSFNLINTDIGKVKQWSYSVDAPLMFFPSMDEHTALSFQLIQAFLKPLLAPETLDAINPLFKKAAEILSQRSEPTARWQEKIHVLPLGLPRKPPRVNSEVKEEIYQALLWELPLRIKYQARSAERVKEYFVTPLGLVIRDYITYVVLTMSDRVSIRYFPLHRFKEAECQDAEYSRPAGFNLRAYANEEFGFPLGKSKTIDLVIWMDNQAAVSVEECPVSKNQTMERQNEDGFILKATVPNTLELKHWILSFGQQVEVLQPQYLRQYFSEELTTLLKRYQSRL
jgi:predicted DNA-binding transcriptional regulator YafY